jgi:hypothetical protein
VSSVLVCAAARGRADCHGILIDLEIGGDAHVRGNGNGQGIIRTGGIAAPAGEAVTGRRGRCNRQR